MPVDDHADMYTHTHVRCGMCAHTCAYVGSCVQEVDVHVTACVCVGEFRCVHVPVYVRVACVSVCLWKAKVCETVLSVCHV